ATTSEPSAQTATSAAPHRFPGPTQETMFSTSPWTSLDEPPSTGRCTIQAQIVPAGGPCAQVSVTAVIATTETDASPAVSQNRRANAGARPSARKGSPGTRYRGPGDTPPSGTM